MALGFVCVSIGGHHKFRGGHQHMFEGKKERKIPPTASMCLRDRSGGLLHLVVWHGSACLRGAMACEGFARAIPRLCCSSLHRGI